MVLTVAAALRIPSQSWYQGAAMAGGALETRGQPQQHGAREHRYTMPPLTEMT